MKLIGVVFDLLGFSPYGAASLCRLSLSRGPFARFSSDLWSGSQSEVQAAKWAVIGFVERLSIGLLYFYFGPEPGAFLFDSFAAALGGVEAHAAHNGVGTAYWVRELIILLDFKTWVQCLSGQPYEHPPAQGLPDAREAFRQVVPLLLCELLRESDGVRLGGGQGQFQQPVLEQAASDVRLLPSGARSASRAVSCRHW